ncbi:hypothetical protein FHU36_002608 [Nonomuraea muscovyensis]|uniref:Uncharacterized protein n=1 Tax=Nonomuraea muscovyensis TaxID=1124761 RepID=A0A7X0EY54_9ACTN|nr:hypothetical protein [Nonomuraea muscovyensis]MBB6346099.1 hypothetical protein [Nonomuraea muscovyensis]
MSLAAISFHLGEDVQFRCHTYADAAPILSMNICGASVDITTSGERDRVSSEALAIVREFVAQARTFLAECERLHAAQLDPAAPNRAA